MNCMELTIEEMETKCPYKFAGIYRIKSIEANRVYVGRSRNMVGRISLHFNSLARGDHHCTLLQAEFDYRGLTFFSIDWVAFKEWALPECERDTFWQHLKTHFTYNTYPEIDQTQTRMTLSQYRKIQMMRLNQTDPWFRTDHLRAVLQGSMGREQF